MLTVLASNLEQKPASFGGLTIRPTDEVSKGSELPIVSTVRDLPLWPIWVNPEHLIRTALVLMRGHGVSALGVMKGDEFLGMLCIEDLVGAPGDDQVRDYYRREFESVHPDTPLRQIADIMIERNQPRLPVLEGRRFLGIVFSHQLLHGLGRNYDPLTQLPWSDSLREWGVKALQAGREVTVVFLDLDDFGEFNKRFGHLVGDRVLQGAAAEIRALIDPTVDHLCRYGGDEFVIGTTRPRDESDRLGERLVERIAALRIDGAGMPVTASVGIHGGRRTRERENVHFAATLDNLINLASKACMAAKAEKDAGQSRLAARATESRRLVSLHIDRGGQTARAVAVVETGSGGLHTGVSTTELDDARAAAAAVAAAFSNGGQVCELIDVLETSGEDDRRILTVVGIRSGEAVAASVVASSSRAESAAQAALQAFSTEH